MAEIYSARANTLLSVTSDKDSITNTGFKVTMRSEDGDDTILNKSSNVTINAGTGNDTIQNVYDNSVTIDAIKGFGTTTILCRKAVSTTLVILVILTFCSSMFRAIAKILSSASTIMTL